MQRTDEITTAMKRAGIILFLALGFYNPSAVSARSVGQPDEMPPGKLITFDEWEVGTNGPLMTDVLVIADDAGVFRVRNDDYEQFPGILEGNYFGQTDSDVTISFAQDVVSAGLGIFDPNYEETVLHAYNRNGELLESFYMEKGPKGGSFSSYGGFVRDSGDIARIVVSVQRGDLVGIDNIRYSTKPAPAPVSSKTAWTLILALTLLVLTQVPVGAGIQKVRLRKI